MTQSENTLKAEQANHHMVDWMVSEGCLQSPRLMEAFRKTPRHVFINRIYQRALSENGWEEISTADLTDNAITQIYSDRALITHLGKVKKKKRAFPISSSSQPSLMAQILEDLQLRPGLHILEIGAGTGYNAALMAYVVGSGLVTTIDVDADILLEAWTHLKAFPERKVEFILGDGRLGCPEKAPFDRIVITAATPILERVWLEQLKERGRLIAPIEPAPGLSFMICGQLTDGVFQGSLTVPAYFMPLRSQGCSDDPDNQQGKYLAFKETWTRIPAPWAKPNAEFRQLRETDFLPALAFLAWLQGLILDYQLFSNSLPCYGIGSPDKKNILWFDHTTWYILGDGEQLGLDLWHSFLNLGCPKPTSWLLKMGVHKKVFPTDGVQSYTVVYPDTEQIWELGEE